MSQNSFQNPISNKNDILSGTVYSLLGLGGYRAEQGLHDISMISLSKISRYDVTNSVQILFDVRKINTKIGITKNNSNNASNNTIVTSELETYFDIYNGKLNTDSFSISANDFKTSVTNSNQILSVGKLNTLYTDFNTYINNYFSHTNGFTTLFDLSNSNGSLYNVFDASGFINIINGSTLNEATGQYILDLSGSISVNNINEIINYLVFQNPFNNRNGENNDVNNIKYLQEGFEEGDLLFIPNGLTITLNVDINNNNIRLNYLGQSYQNALDLSSNYSTGYFTSNMIHTETNMKKVVTAPLLLKLVTLS